MPKVDVSAKTINLCIFVCIWAIDVDVCGMYVQFYMHACRVHACARPYFDLGVCMFIVVT